VEISNMMEGLNEAIQRTWEGLTGGTRPTDESVLARRLGFRHALELTASSMSVEIVSGSSGKTIGESPSITSRAMDISRVSVPRSLAENLRWTSTSGQNYTFLPATDSQQAILLSDRPINFTEDVTEQIRVLMGFPEPKPIDLGMVGSDCLKPWGVLVS
jgi:hypothetical protein